MISKTQIADARIYITALEFYVTLHKFSQPLTVLFSLCGLAWKPARRSGSLSRANAVADRGTPIQSAFQRLGFYV
ncbi:MAG: hypothetical protein KME32_00965 [Mojavia pulchra JT2-VF2]|uniref:Uncharacterized protein n=1 Tax=Mojavia pulchra JT2-VF2 TaxID=287848 RepID=A0A951PTL1_9NOST|nr:hypothetical protein [Mojavia pulchra JT2-VF2]